MGADVVDVLPQMVVDRKPYSTLVREIPLTDNQMDRWELVNNNPAFKAVADQLLNRFGDYGVYGGTALLLELDTPVKDRFYISAAEDLVTSPWGHKIDLKQNADIDLMVRDIGEVNQLASELSDVLGEEFVVTISNLDDYPRIDISLDGVEVMSVADLKSSASQVRRINSALGIENQASDFEDYFTAKFLKNDQDPIWVDERGPKIAMVSDREKPTALLELYGGSIYSPEVADFLKETGNVDLADMVMREWVYGVSKLAVLRQYTVLGMELDSVTKIRKLVDANADFVRSSDELRHTASRRLYKAVNGNFLWFAHASRQYGLLGLFSNELQAELDKVMDDEKSFVEMRGRATEIDNQMFSKKIMEVGDFVDLVLDVSGTTDGEKVKSEFFQNWNPGDMSGVAFQGGRRIK